MPLHGEIFIQFYYPEAAKKMYFYQGHLLISAWTSQHYHRHWNRHWHRRCKKIILAFRIFFLKKIEYFYSFLCLVMTSVPFCYKYLFLYDFLFIYLKVSIGVLEKGNLNVRKHPSISALKKWLLRKFLHTFHTFQRNI